MNELTEWLLLLVAWLAAVASMTVAADRLLLRILLVIALGVTAGLALELGSASWHDLMVGFVTGAAAVAAYRRLPARTPAVSS
ncbi:MAG TPA: hypothetical protein VFM55_18960 [Micromonosporaceae bacterium]|nr:hypothetical protein [Micromonosporaceae bacterium]